MSYGGFEYNQSSGGFGGFDAMSGGGGGFMDSGSGVKQESGKKGGRGDRSIMPVTVKQLHGASSSADGFFIDNAQVNQVRLMGIIDRIDDQSTSVNYDINDGTGVCECKFWKDNDEGSNKHASIRTFDYVRIEGQLRDYEGKKHVLVYAIKKVEDWNEMTHHFLDTIYIHLQHTSGPIPGSTAASGAVSGFNTPGQNAFMQPSFGGGGQGLQLNDGGGNDVKEKLRAAFKNLDDGGDEGVNVEHAFNVLGKEGISRADMKAALTALADDGNLYSTIDEDHYKSTE